MFLDQLLTFTVRLVEENSAHWSLASSRKGLSSRPLPASSQTPAVTDLALKSHFLLANFAIWSTVSRHIWHYNSGRGSVSPCSAAPQYVNNVCNEYQTPLRPLAKKRNVIGKTPRVGKTSCASVIYITNTNGGVVQCRREWPINNFIYGKTAGKQITNHKISNAGSRIPSWMEYHLAISSLQEIPSQSTAYR